jgi:hypothetical protein
VFSYPLILKFRNKVISDGGDVFQSIAGIMNNYIRLDSEGYFRNIFEVIVNMEYDPLSINTYLMFVFGQPAGYNLFWFFSFVASGFGAYLLVKFILLKLKYSGLQVYLSSFIAGFIYTFSSAHFAWSGFRGAHHIEWIPFTTLYILKFIDKPRLKYFLLSGLFFVLLIKGEAHFAAYYLTFLIPFIIFYLNNNRAVLRNKLFKRYALIALAAGVTMLLLFYAPMIEVSLSETNYLNPGIEQTIRYSSDALAIITPPVFSTLLSDLFRPLREFFTGNPAENSNYLGLTAIALVVFALIYYKRSRIKEILFWAVSAIGFFILSLGPFLHFAGTVEPKIPLPYLLIYKYVPFFENIRSVGRLWVIALLCFSIVAGFGMQYLLSNNFIKKYKLQFSLFFVIILLLSVEYLAVPMKMSSLSYSPYYDQIKAENGDFGVVDLPGSTNYLADAKTRYYASIYQKERISGLDPARKIEGKWDFQVTTPVLSEILYTLPNGKELPRDIINHDYQKLANSIFTYYNIPYIIIQKEFIGNGQDYIELQSVNKLREFIRNNFLLEDEYQDDFIFAYKLKPLIDESSVYLAIGDNWNDLNTEKRNRQFTSEAGLDIFNIGDRIENMQIDLDISSFKDQLNQANFYYDNKLIDSYFVHKEETTARITVSDIPKGKSTLNIKISSYDNFKDNPSIYVRNINYKTISDPIISAHGYDLLEDDDKAVLMLRYPSQSDLSNVNATDHKIDGHSVISIQDFIVNVDGNNKLLSTLPLINEFFHWPNQSASDLNSYRDIQDLTYYEDSMRNILAEKNIGYIYLSKQDISGAKEESLYLYLKQIIPSLEKIEGDGFVIYKINEVEKNNAIPSVISSGWDILENKLGVSKRRKINDEANLYLHASEGGLFNLKFSVRTCSNVTTSALIKINGTEDAEFTITGDKYQSLELASEHTISAGINQIAIQRTQSADNGGNTVTCPIWVSDLNIYSTDQ